MMEDIKCNVETGEIEGSRPLSAQAKEQIVRPDYWRGDWKDSLIDNAGPEFLSAFMAVQQEVGGILENDSAGYGYEYASLGAIIAKVLKVMHQHSLILQQYPGKIHGITGNNKLVIADIHTKVQHAQHYQQQQILVSPIPIEPHSYKDKETKKTVYTDIITAQSYGGAFTYGKRYALLSYWGIAPADKGQVPALLDIANQQEYKKIAAPVISGMKHCQSIEELKSWGEANSERIKNIMHPKASKFVYEQFEILLNSLPEKAPEDENQDTQVEELKKTVEKSKVKSDQMDLEDVIEETAA